MIEWVCPECHQHLYIEEMHAEKTVKCNYCGMLISVPASSKPITSVTPVANNNFSGKYGAPPSPPSAVYYYAIAGHQYGPLSEEVLFEMIAQRQLSSGTMVWTQGMETWTKASEIFGLVPPGPFSEASIRYAGFWKRVAATLLDSIILMFSGMILGGIVGGILGGIMGASGADLTTINIASGVAGYIAGTILRWLYYTLLESSNKQATLGKMALGIVVTDMNGQRISFGKANGRYWGMILSSLLLGIGFIMVAFTEKKQGLHDILAGCLVVNK